jgi:hypothetical protein
MIVNGILIDVCRSLSEHAFINFSGKSRYEVDAKQRLNASVAIVAYPKKPDLVWLKDGLPLLTKNDRFSSI